MRCRPIESLQTNTFGLTAVKFQAFMLSIHWTSFLVNVGTWSKCGIWNFARIQAPEIGPKRIKCQEHVKVVGSHTVITENALRRKFDVQYTENLTSNHSTLS